jgi:DNA-binding transcriptional MerR regulator
LQRPRIKRREVDMALKKISEILKLVEFVNEEVKVASKKLSRVTPREVTEKLGTIALIREHILNLQVELPADLERRLTELYPAIDKIKAKPS